VPYAVELFLDARADRRVRRIWAALDGHGVTSLGAMPGCDHHPHVTLAVFEDGEPDRVGEVLRPVLARAARSRCGWRPVEVPDGRVRARLAGNPR
jgi:hypothetical protein